MQSFYKSHRLERYGVQQRNASHYMSGSETSRAKFLKNMSALISNPGRKPAIEYEMPNRLGNFLSLPDSRKLGHKRRPRIRPVRFSPLSRLHPHPRGQHHTEQLLINTIKHPNAAG